jgi:hypothetical protein
MQNTEGKRGRKREDGNTLLQLIVDHTLDTSKFELWAKHDSVKEMAVQY